MIGPRISVLHAADVICILSSIVLKITVVYFVRWLPLGPRFIPIINTSLLVYLTTFCLRIIASDGTPQRRPTTSLSRLFNVLLGKYTPKQAGTNIFALFLNILFYLASVDFVYRGNVLHQSPDLSFSRMGFVDDSTARITIRSPESAYVRINYRPVLDTGTVVSTDWEVGPVIHTSEQTDHVGTFLLTNLLPNTTYSYHTNASVSHTGTFQTSPPHPKKWSMISSSCMSPFFPYSPLSHALNLPGLEHLSNYLSSSSSHTSPKPQFMLFLGDFIYIDLPIRFGTSTSHYTTAYRKVYASPSWTQILKSLPWIHVYDDHEITNDWGGGGDGKCNDNVNANSNAMYSTTESNHLYTSAMTPWHTYQASSNPSPLHSNGTYFTFTLGDVSFFVLDTRRYRSSSSVPDGAGKTMLGAQQLADVLSWLETETARGRLKVLVSSVPFTRNWRGDESVDSWAGYMWERERVLEGLWRTEGGVVVSGDRHEHATTHFPSPDGKSNVIEFSTSPLSQFYQPFERQYRQEEDSDVMIYSHPYGVSKFGVFDFDTSDEKVWKVGFGLVVDGVRVWEYEWSAERRHS